MSAKSPTIALLYDDDAYVETLGRPAQATSGPVGLMGRQVAGKEFLDAYLTHGDYSELTALVRNRSSAQSISNYWRTHPAIQGTKRQLQIVDEKTFHTTFLPTPAAPVLHLPGPLDARYAWARQHAGPGSFALCGLTHTICSAAAAASICSFVTAPFETYDALVCTSQTSAQVVRAIVSEFAGYLRARHGGTPHSRVRLEVIPLGVNTEQFRPPTGDERMAQRKALHIDENEVVVLFLGRVSFHAKAHPFPMFVGLADAARATGKNVHLMLSGWAANQAIMNSFLEGARALAPGVRTSVVDSLAPERRYSIWHAADIFTSPADNIQETFGLTLVQAMACGLPVVASDWNGYRDIVADGETGYLIPTYMVKDATADSTSRLLFGELDYDHFLAESNQSVAVDVGRSAEAYAHLIRDSELRRRMGTAGRQRACERFAWPVVIKAYEALWRGQEAERLAHIPRAAGQEKRYQGPPLYPAPETSFASYPTALLDDQDMLQAAAGANSQISLLFRLSLTNYSESARSNDPQAILAVLRAAASPKTVAELDAVLRQANVRPRNGRATLAWMLKYGLLLPIGGTPG